MKFLTIPNILTLIRLILSPLMLPILLVYLLPFNILWINCLLAILFILFSLTDFFDGYLARKYYEVTPLGSVLDPIADKFLVYSTLVALLAINKIYFYWVVILIGREFFVMGLRLVALEHNATVSISFFGKFKTAAQMLFLTVLIANPYQSLGLTDAPTWYVLELSLLIITLVLSLVSAQKYYSACMHQLEAIQSPLAESVESTTEE